HCCTHRLFLTYSSPHHPSLPSFPTRRSSDLHTRLPGYARGKIGRVEHVRGVHVFADTHAHGRGEQPQWLYTVVFSGRELWGDDCAPGLGVSIDAWEPYLEIAP